MLSSVFRLMVILLPEPVYKTEYSAVPLETVRMGVALVMVGVVITEIVSFGFDDDEMDVTQIGLLDVACTNCVSIDDAGVLNVVLFVIIVAVLL